MLAEDVVFHSPVVHTPQRGKAITTLYLTGAMHTLNNGHFRYERQIVGERVGAFTFREPCYAAQLLNGLRFADQLLDEVFSAAFRSTRPEIASTGRDTAQQPDQ